MTVNSTNDANPKRLREGAKYIKTMCFQTFQQNVAKVTKIRFYEKAAKIIKSIEFFCV
jgi:hypothetical protein